LKLNKDLFQDMDIDKVISEIKTSLSGAITERSTHFVSNRDMIKELMKFENSNDYQTRRNNKRPKTAESIRVKKDGTTFNEDLTKTDYGQIYTLHGDKRKK